MNIEGLGGPFASQPCRECGTDKFVDEPCPRCTAGDYHALMDRLECAMKRQVFLLALVDKLIREVCELEGTADDPPSS